MKKMYNFWALVAAMACTALALGSLNSCVVIDNINPDVEISYSLTGDWNGDFGMYYDYYDRYDRFVCSFASYDTDLSFYPDYNDAPFGYGYQVDFYEHGPYTKIFHTFDWEIRNESIYLYYKGEPELNTIICDYTLGRSRFTGHFNNASSRFTLKKYNDYYDWRGYCSDGNRDGFFYYYRTGWYYDDSMYGTRSNVAAIDTAALKADGQEFTIRYGNRFNK